MRRLTLGGCAVLALCSTGIVQSADSPFLPRSTVAANMEAPVPPPKDALEDGLRSQVSGGELRYIGTVNNQRVYFDAVMKTYVYHPLSGPSKDSR